MSSNSQLQFNHKVYSTNSFWPNPQAQVDSSMGFVGISWDWGAAPVGADLNETVHAHLMATLNDNDFTSARELIESASWESNQIRLAISQSNGIAYTKTNAEEYVAGCEYLGVVWNSSAVSFAKVGGPSVWIESDSGSWNCILGSQNWMFQGSSRVPVPQEVVGTFPNIDVQMASWPSRQCRRIILSHLPIPGQFEGSLENLFMEHIQTWGDFGPFWIGEISQSQP